MIYSALMPNKGSQWGQMGPVGIKTTYWGYDGSCVRWMNPESGSALFSLISFHFSTEILSDDGLMQLASRLLK